MKILKNLIKNETVFCVSFFLAVLSAFFVHPDAAYLTYPDYRTLALLFCLMIIVAGLQSLGIFSMLSQFLLKKSMVFAACHWSWCCSAFSAVW